MFGYPYGFLLFECVRAARTDQDAVTIECHAKRTPLPYYGELALGRLWMSLVICDCITPSPTISFLARLPIACLKRPLAERRSPPLPKKLDPLGMAGFLWRAFYV
jgi:hypothetical protein